MNLDDSDLIELGKYFGVNLISFKLLRESQDDKYADKIRKRALKKLEKSKENYLIEKEMFYAGAIDFMVEENNGRKRFFILETNGGSSRGLSIITSKQQGLLYDGYLQAIKNSLKNNKREDNKLFILVGTPIDDALLHEKIFLLEYLKKKILEIGYSVNIYTELNFKGFFTEDVAFFITDYKNIALNISFKDNWVMYKDQKINLLVGDGIARRIKEEDFKRLMREDFRKINTIIVNPIFLITDDKSLTYLAEYFAKSKLKKYRVKYLMFSKGMNEEDLLKKMDFVVKNYNTNFIIKPSGGSGGAGIIPISSDEDPSNFKKIIKKSKDEFFGKFLKNRDPYPYTIMEMANFSLINWRNGNHTFDIRIYLSQKEGKIIPIGGLVRIARNSYGGTLNKQEFVVNLSGYNGNIEVDRALAISPRTRDILNLSDEDFVDMFCIGCVLFKSFTENYYKIINFSDWSRLIE